MLDRRWISLAGAAGALIGSPALAQTTNRPDSWHMGWGWGWGGMMFGGLAMLVFWGGLIVLIVLAVRWFGGRPGHHEGAGPPHKLTPLEILEERFARGEIDEEEYQHRRRVLRGEKE